MSEIMVTVLCVTYNHKDYIARCIDGIISQKTQYKFELIVHDDASTDGTTEIIKEYEKKYPEIIRGIYENENQYSKGIDIVERFLLPKVKGRFVANCDGDDEWIDPYKMQKQVDFMLDHPNVLACTTNALVKDCRTNEEYNYCNWKRSKYVSVNDVLWGEKAIIKPSTWIIRAKPLIQSKDEISKLGGYTDAPLQLWMLASGKVYYMKDVTIMYRLYVPGSWSSTSTDSYEDKLLRIERFNELTEYRYCKKIRRKINKFVYRRLNNEREMELLSIIGGRRILLSGCVDIALAVLLNNMCPSIYCYIRRIWRKIIHETE